MFEHNLQSTIFLNEVSFVPVRELHKDEKISGRKHIYLRFWGKVIFKTGNIQSTSWTTWSWLNAFAIIQQLTWSLIFYEKYSTSQSDLWFWNFHWADKKFTGSGRYIFLWWTNFTTSPTCKTVTSIIHFTPRYTTGKATGCINVAHYF